MPFLRSRVVIDVLWKASAARSWSTTSTALAPSKAEQATRAMGAADRSRTFQDYGVVQNEAHAALIVLTGSPALSELPRITDALKKAAAFKVSKHPTPSGQQQDAAEALRVLGLSGLIRAALLCGTFDAAADMTRHLLTLQRPSSVQSQTKRVLHKLPIGD